MKRGDLVTVAAAGDYGKPRPAIIVQSDALLAVDSVLVALISSHRREAPLYRLSLSPTAQNGLREPSDVLVEKIIAMPRVKIGPTFGSVDDEQLLLLNRMLAFVLGLADLGAGDRQFAEPVAA